MATTNTTSQYRRASEFSKGIGASLDSVAGKDVLLTGFTVEQRGMGEGDPKTIVYLDIATVDHPDDSVLFHAWSDSLAEKLGEIDKSALPLLILFEQAKTRGGFKVWTFR
jgi:hypothetical protein